MASLVYMYMYMYLFFHGSFSGNFFLAPCKSCGEGGTQWFNNTSSASKLFSLSLSFPLCSITRTIYSNNTFSHTIKFCYLHHWLPCLQVSIIFTLKISSSKIGLIPLLFSWVIGKQFNIWKESSYYFTYDIYNIVKHYIIVLTTSRLC